MFIMLLVDDVILSQIDQDFVATQVKKINDARRKVLEGVGRGMARIATTHAS